MNNAEDLYNEVYYIYKNKCNEEEFNLNTKNRKRFDYKKLRLIDNFYESEGEEASRLSRLVLPKWIKVSEKRFNEILNKITEAKNNELKINVNGKEVILDRAESLLKDLSSEKINKQEFKKEYNSIVNDIIPVLDKSVLTKNENNMVKILSLLRV